MQYFKSNAVGIDPVNAFILAKMNELMYPERLDYQLRYLQNNSKVLETLPSTNHLKAHPFINNSNFKTAFENRLSHYFSSDSSSNKAQFYFIEKPVLDTFNFLGIKSIKGYDPEIIVINQNDLILILYRGTDDVNDNRYAEWKGSDFSISKVPSDSVLNNSKIHKGFWKSFDIVKEELINLLDSLDAKNKKIWISGHSLGGAMAILTGVYLQQSNYSITNIYTYAAPIAIGDKNFAELGRTVLTDRIQRFEYYLDPVSILWAPGYATFGQRNWIDNATKSNYTFYPNCGERYFFRKLFEFRTRTFTNKENQEFSRVKKEKMSRRILTLPSKFFYHNTQWYVKGTYLLIPLELRSVLPRVDDSYPFIYYGWDQAK
ncbi:MAG: hypothetical protein RI883_2100 [Bacteroidota bacterium]|jgi:hypothetical protein